MMDPIAVQRRRAQRVTPRAFSPSSLNACDREWRRTTDRFRHRDLRGRTVSTPTKTSPWWSRPWGRGTDSPFRAGEGSSRFRPQGRHSRAPVRGRTGGSGEGVTHSPGMAVGNAHRVRWALRRSIGRHHPGKRERPVVLRGPVEGGTPTFRRFPAQVDFSVLRVFFVPATC